MASKLTKDGLILPDTGDFKQEKTVISVEGVEADSEGKIVLSSDQNKTLDQRMTEIDNTVDGRLLDIENRLSSVESGPTNLFLDSSLIVIQSQEITDWTYGPNNNETYPVVDHAVPEFENFFDNHLNKNKLSIHTGDSYSEVLIDDLKSFFDTPNELSTTLGAPVNQQEVFNNWTRFSHWDGISRGNDGVGSTSGAFPANASDTQAWVYDATTGDIVCTKNTDTLTGFVSQQKYEDYFYQTTLSSTAIDNDIISVVLAFVIDPDGTEHTITAVRLTSLQFNLVLDAGQHPYNDMVAAAYTDAQMTAYTPTTSWLGTPSAWALVYNLGQSNAKVLANGDSTAPALWVGDTTANHSQTTGDDTLYAWGDGNHDNSTDDGTSINTTVVRVRRQGNGFEAWCSQWNQSDIDGATRLTLDLDSDPDLLRFKGKQSYGVSSMSQESARFSNQKFAETEFTFWYDSSDNDNRNVFQLRNNDLILKQYSPYAGSEHFKVYRIDLHPESTDPSPSSSGTVTSVNNVLPDYSGNVTIDVGSGGSGTVTSVNNVQPDSNGNVTIDVSSGGGFTTEPFTDISDTGSLSIGFLRDKKVYFARSDGGVGFGDQLNYKNLNPAANIPSFSEYSFPKDIKKFWIGHTLGVILTEDGDLYTWGLNEYGECGHGSTDQILEPTKISSLGSSVVDFYPPTSYYSHWTNTSSIGLEEIRLFIKKNDGTIWGCGYNSNGALGLGDTTNRTSFTEITSAGTNPLSVWNLGQQAGCLVVQKSDFKILVSGLNRGGHLGDGTEGTGNKITTLTDLTSNWNNSGEDRFLVKAMGSFGREDYTSLLMAFSTSPDLTNSTATCFLRSCGDNRYGQLGLGNTTDITTPSTVNTTGSFKDLYYFGHYYGGVVLLNHSGNLYSWGYNTHGQVANGNFTHVDSPNLSESQVSRLLNVTQGPAGTGEVSIFIEKSDGLVYSTGYNGSGQLGQGFQYATGNSSGYRRVKLPYDVTVVSIGCLTTNPNDQTVVCSTDDGSLFMWGYVSSNYVSAYSLSLLQGHTPYKFYENDAAVVYNQTSSSVTVTSVNNVQPDSNGNVTIDVGSGTVTSVNNVQPDSNGNVTIDVSSGGGGGFTNMEVFTASGSWNVPAGVDKIKLTVTGAGENTANGTGGGAGGTAIGIFSVSADDELIITVSPTRAYSSSANPNYSQVSITGKNGYIRGSSATWVTTGGQGTNSLSGLIPGTFLGIRGGSSAMGNSTLQGNTDGAASIYGSGPAYGGGAAGNSTTGTNNAGQGVVIVEY